MDYNPPVTAISPAKTPPFGVFLAPPRKIAPNPRE
jgi:hypothetical protein